MKLVVNGNKVDSKDNVNISELLVEQSVKMPEMVSVEVNGTIIPRVEFDATVLKDNDKIEYLYFMGGGQCKKRPLDNIEKITDVTIRVNRSGPTPRMIKRELREYKFSLEEEGKNSEEVGKLLCTRLKEIREKHPSL